MIERKSPIAVAARPATYAGTGTGITADAQKVLRNTYMLLSLTLLWSAMTAGLAMAIGLPLLPMHSLISFVGMIGLLFWVQAARNSSMGLVAVFAFTGFIGFMLGPVLTAYVKFIPHGGQMLLMSLGGTGTIFLGLSAVALTTKKDFSFMGGFLLAGMLVVFFAAIATMVAGMFGVAITGAVLAISCISMLVFSAAILYDTSRIIHGGETNYISATVALYLDIYNIFISLLNITGIMSSDD
jgi:modulator of FtsH protease